MVNPHQAKAKAMSLHWVIIISSLPVAPGERERGVALQLGPVAIWAKSDKNIAFAFAWCGLTIRVRSHLAFTLRYYIFYFDVCQHLISLDVNSTIDI